MRKENSVQARGLRFRLASAGAAVGTGVRHAVDGGRRPGSDGGQRAPRNTRSC